MTQQKKQRIIIVLAMHRSGSSTIARGLNALGVDLGDNLMPATPGENQKGFWEDLDIYRFSERALKKTRSVWHALGRIDEAALQGPAFADERREAAQLLSEKIKPGRIFGFKDPRTSILMPLWRRAFDDMGLDDRYVVTVRNPLECATSLNRRDGFPVAKGVLLWSKHMIDAIRHSSGKPRLFVAYDNILKDCHGELARMARGLDLPEPREGDPAVREYCQSFLSRSLRHHTYSDEDFSQSRFAPPFVLTLSQKLAECASAPDGESSIHRATLAKLQRRQEEYAPLLEIVDMYDAACSAAQKEAADLQATVDGLNDKAKKTASEMREMSGTISRLNANAEQTAAEMREMSGTNKALTARIEDADKTIAQNVASIEDLTAQRDEAENRAAQLSATNKELAAERDRQANRISALGSELNAAKAEAAATREMLAERQAALKAVTRDYRLSRAEIRDIRTSTSWRITAPVRAVGFIFRNPIGRTRRVLGRFARLAWRALPMPADARGQLAGRLFKAAPFLFFWSRAYAAWREEQRRQRPADGYSTGDKPFRPPLDPDLERCAPLTAKQPPERLAARAIAFYLPQFHAIPENDAWWGEGFTEWTKVKPAKPLFEGHYQPHMPGELGYYDLLKDDGVMARQIELARLHGLSGFCFYFYWFAGKRLLEAPLEKFLAAPDLDFPFCLCWANENWTRRWDGKDSEILIGQAHSPQDDTAFIEYVSRYLRDPRYIKVNGRPLLIVYRPALLPSPKATAEIWRQWCRENGIGEIYLAYTQSFETDAPQAYGFDAAIEFPPNNSGLAAESGPAAGLPESSGLSIYDWRKVAARCMRYDKADYTLYRGVNPAWDNTPRRPRDGAVFVNTSPSWFKAWLTTAAADARKRFENPDQRLIFINAWNEWAEGAYLEPDQKYGYAWLEAMRRALDENAGANERKILIVIHDLHRHGAQYLALHMAQTLRRQFGFDIATIVGGPGALADAFSAEGPLTVLDPQQTAQTEIDAAAAKFAALGFRSAIVNSAASGWIAPTLARHGYAMIGLVHEMPSIIEKMDLTENLRAFDTHARAVVFPSATVRDKAAASAGLTRWSNPVIAPQGVYKAQSLVDPAEKETARAVLSKRYRLPADAVIILGVGYADHRKGVDIFIEWASAAAERWPNAYFIWLGKTDPEMRAVCKRLLSEAGAHRNNIRFPGFIDDTRDYYLAANLYALTSREDPFPSTALEALSAATPVVMVKGTGGIEDLAPHGCVKLAASAAPAAFLEAAAPLIENEQERRAAGKAGRDLMRSRFGFTSYMGALTDLVGAPTPNVSVIVPNYNYARHLEQRLKSILDQTLSPREIIFLDDASTDASIATAERVLGDCPVNWRIVENTANSGDVFAQWRKGVSMASGDIIWIAEADDWADPRFLETATRLIARDDVVLSFTQSNQVDEKGRLLARDYHDYVRDVSPEKWANGFVNDGLAEVREGLSIKNTIPNVSAALFRRAPLLETLAAYDREIGSYRVAGDWCVYVNLLRKGAIAYSPEALNYHRRHGESVTINRFDLAELAEIARMQAYVAEHFAPPPEYAAKARAYLEGLVKHFHLERRYDAAKIDAAMAGATA